MHLNKVLYTFSYTCFTAGVAGILFAGIYLTVGCLVILCDRSHLTKLFYLAHLLIIVSMDVYFW